VCGPPGAGKTTLVASYLVSRRRRGLWYQLDPGDADVATFLYYLARAAPRRRRPLPLLRPEYRHDVAAFARRYFRELFRRLRAPFTVVFDNYQDVAADSPLHEVMQAAVAEIPRGGRVIFISRHDPPPSFARHRIHQAIEIVDGSEIRFTRMEANRMVRRRAPGRWPRETVRRLLESAGGWCAGLVLLLEQLRSEGRISPAPGERTSQLLFEYFAGEIFNKADAGTREVLLRTAFPPGVTVPMAVALTGRSNAGRVLADLARQNYFTTRRAGEEPTYEFHPLFREFLLSQADRTYTAAQRSEIRRAGAELLEAGGQIEAAAELLRDAEDWESLARLTSRQAPMLVAHGRLQTLEGWLGSLSEPLLSEDPWRLYWRGMCCRHTTGHADCRRDTEQALAGFRARRDAEGAFRAWSTAVFSIVYELDDARLFDHWIAMLDELVREFPAFPSEEIELRVAMGMLAAVALRQPQHPDARRWAERALELSRRHPDPIVRAEIAFSWTLYHVQGGDFARAASVIEELQELARARNASPLAAQPALVALSRMWPGGTEDVSLRAVNEGLELARASGVRKAYETLLLEGAALALSRGDLATAAASLREMAGEIGGAALLNRLKYHAYVVWEALLRADVERAAAAAQSVLRLCGETGRPYWEAIGRLLALQALHESGDSREARREVALVVDLAVQTRSRFVEFMARLAAAQIAFDEGRADEGAAALRVAMALGREGGYSTTYGWRPTVMARLCAQALEAGIEVAYVQGLIRKRGLMPEEPSVQIEAWPWPVRVFTLGQFAVLKDGQPLRFSRKVQRKPLALLAAIIASDCQRVREERLLDFLWPEAEGDAARFALTTTVHRLRCLLGHKDAIVRKDYEVSLNAHCCWVDAWAVDRLLERAEAALARSSEDERAWTAAVRATEQTVRLYRGPFLGGEAHWPWAAPLADRLRRRLLRQLIRVGLHWEGISAWQESASCYETALTVDPCAEDACRRLMTSYHRLGRPADVHAAFRLCREALAERGTRPSPETDALRTRFRAS
jgi:ATP/maltotriose-dependent transcriptional regulator MalT/DNA-binding SARP family transcriptional activator